MKIKRKRLNLNSLSYSREYDVDRSAGIHLMQIVEYIAQVSGIEKKHSGDVNLDPFAALGFTWEHVLTRADKFEHAMSVEAMRTRMIHRAELTFPGEQFWCRQCRVFMRGGKFARKHCREFKHRGIFFTPDGFNTKQHAYEEWKLTYKSSKKSHPKVLHTKDGIWRWGVQCMANCYGLGTTTAILTVVHVNGDYKPGLPEPQPYRITYEFTERELRRNWLMITTTAINKGWV